MIQPIKTVQIIKLVKEITTIGSSPLLVMADDNNEYYIKTTVGHPCIELINEVLCGYFLQLYNLSVPPFALAKVSDGVFTEFVASGGKLSDRYYKKQFSDRIFFASQMVSPVIEFESYLGKSGFLKKDYETISNPLDIIKIGLFDIWVGNKDRKPENPNILLKDKGSKFIFCPIDHTAAFAHCTDYKQVTEIFVFLEYKFRIFRLPFIKSISKWIDKDDFVEISKEISFSIVMVLQNLNDIFAQIPSEWGFSKKAKEHLAVFLNTKIRNEKLINIYFNEKLL